MTVTTPDLVDALAPLRAHAGVPKTPGLTDEQIAEFAGDPDLQAAVVAAADAHDRLSMEFGELLDLDEAEQIARVQSGFLNFYGTGSTSPYLTLAARGPWIVTLKGAVVHDTGGYGMLGFGHSPQPVLDALAAPQPMANIMTPNLAQLRFDRALRGEIGHTRGGCPFDRFLCLNSGSEAVGLAARIADVNAWEQTRPGGPRAGRTVKGVVVRGSFHGRTDRPAMFSDSTRATYVQHLASHQGESSVIAVDPYDVAQLEDVFARADAEGWFIEAVFLEPVMGEGDPGRALPVEFYAAARRLTREHDSLLLVDSIQAGLRCHGVLSVVDYPGFADQEAPDLETYSKAINAAQFPLSVLAVNERAAGLYRTGVYGNTMTANPRALDVASATLGMVTPKVRSNIVERGREALARFEQLQADLGGAITKVQGTGLLFSCELAPEFTCYGHGSTEEWLRQHGMNVIHGGENSLRFTPHFGMTSEELELLATMVGRALREGPRRS